MPKTLGMPGFAARRVSGGTPRVQAYPRDAATVATEIKKGHPVVLLATGLIRRATVAADYMNDAAILGFSNEHENSDLPQGFAIPPKIKNEAGIHELGILVASPETIFSANMRATITVDQTDVGTPADLRYDAVADQFSPDNGSHTTDTIKIVGIEPGQVGVAGGLVDFMVQRVDNQWAETTI